MTPSEPQTGKALHEAERLVAEQTAEAINREPHRPVTEAGLRIWDEKPIGWTGQDWRTAILAIEREAQGIPLIDVELLRKALNDYDAFVAFREDDDRDVTIRDRHDWAERWVARLASESSPAEEGARPCPVCGTSGPHTVLGADDMPDHRWPAEEGAE